MKKLIKDRHAFLQTIVVVLIVLALYKLARFGVGKLPLAPILNLFLGEIILLALAIAAAVYLKKLDVLKPTFKGFGTALLVGLWFILQPAYPLILQALMGWIEITISTGLLILFFLAVILIGIAEELVFRGILLNGFLDACGEDSPGSIRAAVLLSGVMFGAIHLFNVLSGAEFTGALLQAGANIGSGALFGATYVRSRKNLWACALLHAFLDLCAFMTGSDLLTGGTVASSVSELSPAVLVIGGIELLIALFAMRKKKLLPLVK